MRIGCLATMMALATTAFLGCGSDSTQKSESFEIAGNWLFLGPASGEHRIKISDTSMVYSAVDGTWSSTWTIKDYDNALDHFEIVFGSGTGTYMPTGDNLSGTYVLENVMLSIQLAKGLGAYSPVKYAGSCTDSDSKPVADCGLYMKEQ
jgi:hypothetical protein